MANRPSIAGMRWTGRIISALLVMTFGYIWTVGQGGFGTVNKNLCDLLENTFGRPPSCQFNKVILQLWGIGALCAVLFLISDLVRWLRRRKLERNRVAESNGVEETSLPCTARSPLQIIFETSNPHNRFWQKTSPRDKDGNILPGIVTEYRIKVQNASSKTVRNVRLSKESSGLIPQLPVDLVFQKDQKQSRDLQPACYEFVPVFWQYPPQAGDACRETATAFHGPIKIIASGDDVLPEECEFDYYPEQVPAIIPRRLHVQAGVPG